MYHRTEDCLLPTESTPPPPLRPGLVLAGRYALVRELGRGGVGRVWLALDALLDEAPVAIKLLREAYRYDRRALADLKREVLLTRRLRHPNILGVHTFHEGAGQPFIVMDYVSGDDLRTALLARGGPFALRDVLGWLPAIAQALDYAHENGVLHRDIKPGNLLRGNDGRVRLADFGIARTLREVHQRLSSERTAGTVQFMSPEQMRGGPVDRRSDLYSLAASVYELLSGAPPCGTRDPLEAAQFGTPSPIDALGPDVNDALLAGLARETDARPATCGAWAAQMLSAAGASAPPAAAGQVLAPRAPTTRELRAAAHTLARVRLGVLLAQEGLATPEQIDGALRAQEATGRRLGDVLVAQGVCSEATLAQVLSQQSGLAYDDLAGARPDEALVARFSAAALRLQGMLPLQGGGRPRRVALCDPLDVAAIDAFEATLREPIVWVLTTRTALEQALARAFGDAAS